LKDTRLRSLLIALVLPCCLLSSCLSTTGTLSSNGIEKRRYTKGYHINKLTKKAKSLKEAATGFEASRIDKLPRTEAGPDKRSQKTLRKDTRKQFFNAFSEVTNLRLDSLPCGDLIIFRNGKVVSAKVRTIGIKDIIYQKCDNLFGPQYTVRRSEVLRIEYNHGEADEFEIEETYYAPPVPDRHGRMKREGFAIGSFISGILAVVALSILPLASLVFMVVAIAFGSIGLRRIKMSNGEVRGKGLAIAGMVLGLVLLGIILLVVVLTILLFL